ncbi:MAG: HAMP domain-containing protein [Desulfobacterales bacterium]|uniref:histidine kinase n=1 Tax=Candidatus Desulfatibia vada TaxID=2841696 RepID=A0A8J6P0Z1_9BACT|nr:HAMP domain-containing protein [Candidatus Desulfatibia vada]
MKISIRQKIILSFAIFIGISAIIWFRSYYSQYVLHQKLQIIERKNSLFNTILEARRYEKNFFLSLDKKNIDQALDYIHEAEDILSNITSEYGKYTLAKNLPERLIELKAYKKSLLELLELQNNGTLLIPRETTIFIQQQGHKITTELEKIVKKEGQFTQDLVGKTKTIHYIALVPVFILSILIALFLIFNVNRPLKAIENAIKKISKGDFKNIPDISTGDEFEYLVDSLNNMINELNKRNEELVQARKLESLGRLTSGVAHELNNPLNNISTSVQILLEEIEENNLEYKMELLTGTEKEVDRARNIVRALLEFSRERALKIKTINFLDLVNEAVHAIKRQVPAHVKLKVQVPEDIQIDLDPGRMQSVLINLMLNAVQAMESGGTLSVSAKQNNKEEFSFQVQDTGCGISEENISKIFDPFFSTKEVGKGSGLGLSIIYGIIELHGGRIQVTSKEGEGATFTIFLPTRI